MLTQPRLVSYLSTHRSYLFQPPRCFPFLYIVLVRFCRCYAHSELLPVVYKNTVFERWGMSRTIARVVAMSIILCTFMALFLHVELD